MASARIWHVCDGDQQMERVESLTGTPRSTFRHNNNVVTFFPETKVARSEQREALGIFPNFLKSNDSAIAEFYTLKSLESERVAGVDAEVVKLIAKDSLRYSYRIWTERKSGLVVKLQTLDLTGRVIEQAAFSELNLEAPVKMERLAAMMNNTAGHKLEQVAMVKTTALAQGWALQRSVPGFASMSCFKRPAQLEAASSAATALEADKAGTMQWIFSDGLATVSLFVEPFDRKRHSQEGAWSMGATQTLAKRLDDWWLTAVGEVPAPTLKVFAQQLERKK
jgi:sigma-E factor negative regulatory protein RseB